MLLACGSEKTKTAPLPSIPCAAAEVSSGMDPANDVHVFVDDAVPDQVRADLASYLGRMWKTTVAVQVGTPAGQTGDALWISSSADAKTAARHTTDAPNSYSIVRADDGSRKMLVAYADKPNDLVSATYAMLEELGVRFFHPREELVPELGSPFFPRGLDAHRTALTKVRGLQPHVLHPIEWMHSLHEPSDESLAESKQLIDWLVKTGQNHLQWPLMDSPWEPLAEHVRKIADYAHARGVTIGAMVQLDIKGALQKNYVLVHDDAQYQQQIEDRLTQLMQAPWDEVELALGEFLSADPESLITWLNTAVAHLAKIAPNVRVAAQNHVGNYPSLYVTFRGMPNQYYYHLPAYADARLGQTVHTLFWFDLYREGGMYQHPNFHFQHDFILDQLAKGVHRVRYFPESAYWIATDIDVPAFLPEFIEGRYNDIHGLDQELRDKQLPPLDGHVQFSSGHEWNYWMHDYMTAKMLWEPGATLERFLTHYTSAYGSCAPKIEEDFSAFIGLERQYLYEKKLIKYVSGEDNAVDLGKSIGGVTIRELRKSFDDVVTGSEGDRVALENGELADIEALAKQIKPIEDDIAAHCRGSDPTLAPWCSELQDGVSVLRMRLEQSALVYHAVLAYARNDKAGAKRLLAATNAKIDEATPVIQGRSKHYRFDVGRLTNGYTNTTNYAFGYLRQAHTQCFWHRETEQARRIIEEDLINSAPTGLPSCLN